MIRYIKIVLFLLCLVPLAFLLWGFFGATPKDMTTWGAGLGANPIDVITRTTGRWTLTFLLITLSVTPARKLSGLIWLIRFRRMLGLFAFFYGCLHLTTYVWLDKFFDVHEMLHDIAKRRFITAGLTAWTLMFPLALTSTTGWIRRMGGKMSLASMRADSISPAILTALIETGARTITFAPACNILLPLIRSQPSLCTPPVR